MRFTFKLIAGILGGLFVLGLLLKANADRNYFAAYDAATPLNAVIVEKEERSDYLRENLSFESTPGEPIPTILTLPKAAPGKVPCVVFLHGIGQEKDFIDEICAPFNQAGFAMATFDQYTRGERKLSKDASPWQQLVAFRARAAKTVNDARRLVDYLQTRSEIDPERIYLVGASYGAITGTTAAAFDPRFKAVVLVYGGGNIRHLMAASAIRGELEKGPAGWLVADLASAAARYVLAPADPLRYAHLIAPRPVLLQNGTVDILISDAAAKALQEAVQEPKKITIYPGDHIGLDEATTRKVLQEGLDWIKEQDSKVQAGDAPATLPAAA